MVDVPDELELTAPQARVLGCLMEKQATTPDAYPMTLKALTTACNQTSSRNPVVAYEPTLVEATIHALKGKGLARIVHPARGERSTKYRHVADEALELDDAARAVVAVLLLRGAQTVNELKSRTDRLHHFATPAEVTSTLEQLRDGARPMVGRVPRGPGQKEERWIQLLEGDVDARAAASTEASPAPRSARSSELADRVERLEGQLAALVEALGDLLDADTLAAVRDVAGSTDAMGTASDSVPGHRPDPTAGGADEAGGDG